MICEIVKQSVGGYVVVDHRQRRYAMKRILIAIALLGPALPASGCGGSGDTSSSTESCTVRITNPSDPNAAGLHSDIQFQGNGAQFQCNGMHQFPAQLGYGVVNDISAPEGDKACSVSVSGLTVAAYGNDPTTLQRGCAWMQQRATQLQQGSST